MQLHEFDVRPLEQDDFDVVNESSELFIEFTKLGLITARILDFYARRLKVACQKVRPGYQFHLQHHTCIPPDYRLSECLFPIARTSNKLMMTPGAGKLYPRIAERVD